MAASSSSRGTDSNEMRIMNVANGSWNIVSTSATPTSEFCSPTALSSTYSGISRVAYGTIRIASVSRNSSVAAREAEPRERVAAEQRDQRG